MAVTESLNHSVWDCKYHVVFIPKYRRKVLYKELRRYLGEVFHDLAAQRESKVVEGHLMGDHVHMLISIPPKYSVSQTIGFIKGKSAIYIARAYVGKRKNFRARVFGLAGISCPPLGAMRKRSGTTFPGRKWRTKELTSWECGRGSRRL